MATKWYTKNVVQAAVDKDGKSVAAFQLPGSNATASPCNSSYILQFRIDDAGYLCVKMGGHTEGLAHKGVYQKNIIPGSYPNAFIRVAKDYWTMKLGSTKPNFKNMSGLIAYSSKGVTVSSNRKFEWEPFYSRLSWDKNDSGIRLCKFSSLTKKEIWIGGGCWYSGITQAVTIYSIKVDISAVWNKLDGETKRIVPWCICKSDGWFSLGRPAGTLKICTKDNGSTIDDWAKILNPVAPYGRQKATEHIAWIYRPKDSERKNIEDQPSLWEWCHVKGQTVNSVDDS